MTCANMSLHSDRKKLRLFPSGEFRVLPNDTRAPYGNQKTLNLHGYRHPPFATQLVCRFHWASRSYSGVTRGSIADRTISRDVVAVLSVTCGQLHRPGYTGLPWMESRKPRSAYDRFPESIPYPIVLCSLSVLFGLAIPAHSLRHFNSSNVLGRILFSARRDCRLDESYANTNQLDTRK